MSLVTLSFNFPSPSIPEEGDSRSSLDAATVNVARGARDNTSHNQTYDDAGIL